MDTIQQARYWFYYKTCDSLRSYHAKRLVTELMFEIEPLNSTLETITNRLEATLNTSYYLLRLESIELTSLIDKVIVETEEHYSVYYCS